jgi:hypothetical protein
VAARRCRRRSAAARSRPGPVRNLARGVPKSSISRRASGTSENRADRWTCRSRWRRGWRPLAGARQRDVVQDLAAVVRDARAARRHCS